MKPSTILRFLFAFVAVVCLSVGAYGATHGAPEMAGLIAAAPVMASFDMKDLKMPAAEFDDLKAKYKNLYVLNVDLDEAEKYQFIVRRPSRDVINAMASNKDNITKANDILIKGMVVGGDMDALDDGVVYTNLLKQLGSIVSQGQSFLAKA